MASGHFYLFSLCPVYVALEARDSLVYILPTDREDIIISTHMTRHDAEMQACIALCTHFLLLSITKICGWRASLGQFLP